MVASQCLQMTGNTTRKTVDHHVELDFDFSDVFGAPPQLPSAPNTNGLVYDEPEVICSRSHSLVGPTTFTNQSMKLSTLTLHETEYDLVEGITVSTMALKELEEASFVDDDDGSLVKIQSVGLEDFEILKVVGQGAFAKVYQVRKHGSSEIFAMKVMRKDRIFEKDHAEYMKAERDILTKVDHPFIVQLKYSFQTKHRLFLVLDFVNGGHLFFQLYRQGLFREDLARFYTAEIVSAVSHLHANGIMHRDLKPENILLDAEGHVMLTDFGVAKQFDESTRSNSMCGTLEYMSPEIVQGRGHDKAADWWSVGILMYEMLTGKPPFRGGNRQKIQEKIVKDKIKLPGFLSSEAHSLLKGLLQKDSSRRLGSGAGGGDEIKKHGWFKVINWRKLEGREIKPSFVPQVAGKQCIANFEECWTNMPPLLDSPAASPKCKENPFKGFTYVRPAQE
ncbi:serine/threonine-protein kinase AtPK2/AtPK19 [Lactuca sativa]|uniref:serine/threonine-protein kinase AtPK2/AtPK19 n=1 Tax=Lactuca sativa TaxID=4236 RepID=UPI000CC99B00|nr:serine/threonine-protein kinase AtPK2/AtPK19 [Lactuca sativa]